MRPTGKAGMGISRFHSGGASQRGFTLIELMVSVTVLAIVLSLAIPSFTGLLAANRMTNQASQLIGALKLAHSEAVRRAQPVTLLSNNVNNYSLGWTVFPDANADGAAASSTDAADGLPLLVAAPFANSAAIKRVTRSNPPAPYTYTNSADSARMRLVFTSRGAITATSAAFFRVCDPTNPTAKGRIVQVNVVGKISLDSSSESCP
jgi:type IV fimbrial biogenesis protein FimT